jgi:dTDP-glucose 4,6-dehydratase
LIAENILIIGSNSFSGAAFGASLPDKYKKHNVFRTSLPSDAFIQSNRTSSGDTYTQWNLNDDPKTIQNLIRENDIKTIVNFAAQSMVGQSWEKPEDWYEANNVSFSRLLRLIAKEETVSKFIQFTTPEVYGSTDGWVKENFHFAPTTPYAISRAASDWHLKALYETFGFPVIFTRAANVYGEHQRLYRIIPRVILSALTGRKVPLQGGGKSIRSFIHIEDVCGALVRIMESGKLGESYHISTNELITIYELVQLISIKLDVNIKDLVEMAPDRSGKDYAYQLDSQKIRGELGWTEKISLDIGLDRTIKWVQDNLDELKNLSMDYEHKR